MPWHIETQHNRSNNNNNHNTINYLLVGQPHAHQLSYAEQSISQNRITSFTSLYTFIQCWHKKRESCRVSNDERREKVGNPWVLAGLTGAIESLPSRAFGVKSVSGKSRQTWLGRLRQKPNKYTEGKSDEPTISLVTHSNSRAHCCCTRTPPRQSTNSIIHDRKTDVARHLKISYYRNSRLRTRIEKRVTYNKQGGSPRRNRESSGQGGLADYEADYEADVIWSIRSIM